MPSEKKVISSFTVKVGLALFAGCILAPISLMTMFRLAVPLQTLRLLFSVGSVSSMTLGEQTGSADGAALFCDMSSPRSDVCELKGDVRVFLPNTTIVFLHPTIRRRSWRMKPHARKNDRHALSSVTEVSLSVVASSSLRHAPSGCTAESAAPAVIFSAGGYAGNMFHDFTDVLVPLFITASQFHGEVHFLVSDAPSWWLDKYQPLLRMLSRHAIIDMNRRSSEVLCYRHVIVGLRFHKEMSIDAAKTVGGRYSMADFARLARTSYGLERDRAIQLPRNDNNNGGGGVESHHRPRLLIISRKATRAFTNVDAIARTASILGYNVVVGEADQQSDLAALAQLVNSCDVLVCLHGAVLTNLVFLPAGAVVVQVVPLGGLEAAAVEAFGAPARDMGLGYVQYNIAVEESSQAARVLAEPPAVRKEGWLALWSAYLVGQNVTLDVARFRGALSRALELLRH